MIAPPPVIPESVPQMKQNLGPGKSPLTAEQEDAFEKKCEEDRERMPQMTEQDAQELEASNMR